MNPPPINRLPFGLLGFLGIKNGGQYPQELVRNLQPTWDLMEHYASLNSEEYALLAAGPIGNTAQSQLFWATTTPNNIVVGSSLTVPQTEAWFISQYNVRWFFNAVAGEECDASPEIVPLTGSIRIGGALNGFTTSNATVARGGGRAIDRPIWALPGSQICARIWGALSAASFAVTGSIRFSRFPM